MINISTLVVLIFVVYDDIKNWKTEARHWFERRVRVGATQYFLNTWKKILMWADTNSFIAHMIIFGIIGLLIISYAIWVRDEKKQDYLFILGGLSLLLYSIYIKDLIFIALQIIFILSAIFEIYKKKWIRLMIYYLHNFSLSEWKSWLLKQVVMTPIQQQSCVRGRNSNNILWKY